MSNTIKLKRGSGSDPGSSDLVVGELAIRTDLGKIFLKKDNGNIAEVSGGGGVADGDKGEITVSNSGDTWVVDNNVIDEANLKISNSPTNGYFLQAQSGNTGGLTWAEVDLTTLSASNLTSGTINTNRFGSSTISRAHIQDNAINADKIADSSITSAKILDDSIVNADINSSAAIAGTKISPDFGSQDITTTGVINGKDLILTDTHPAITFTDSDHNPDYRIKVNNGMFEIVDLTNSVDTFQINSDGHIDIAVNLDCEAGLDVTGAITSTGNLSISNTTPTITFTDTDDNPDYEIKNANGTFKITDTTNSADKIVVQWGGHIDLKAHVDCENGLDVTGGLDVSSNITVGGTVDGRDIATDGSKLDGIESGATADQTKSDIDALGIAATTAATLATARTIAGVSFDGSANISLNNNAITNGAGYITASNAAITNKLPLAGGTLTGNVIHNDDVKAIFGTSSDGLEIYHSSDHSYIADTGSGYLRIQAADYLQLGTSTAADAFLNCESTSGAVYINHNGNTKIASTSTGVDVTGNITVTGTVDGVDIAARNTLFGGLTSSSGVLTNGVTATTQSASDNSTKVATTAYTDTAISNLVDSSPSALNTLNELAAALGDDANFSTTVTNSIATKLPLAGGTLTGTLTARDINPDGDNTRNIGNGTNNYASIWASTRFRGNDGVKLVLGSSQDFIIHHSVNANLIEAPTNHSISINTGTGDNADKTSIHCAANGGAVDLRFADSAKLTTSNTGVTVSGTCTATTFSGSGASLTNVNATTLDSIDSGSFLRSDASDTFTGTLTLNNVELSQIGSTTQNLKVKGNNTGGSTDAGISLFNNADGWCCQLYGTNSGSATTYGFLGANWGGWDLQKAVDGHLYIKQGGSMRTVWHDNNDGSGSGLDADTVDGIQAASFLRSDAGDSADGDITFNGGGGAVTIGAGSDISFSSGGWTGDAAAKIQNHGNWLYIAGGTNGIAFRMNSGASDKWYINNSGHFYPTSNNQVDIGTSSLYVNNSYLNWIATNSGDRTTTAPTRYYASDDSWIRYYDNNYMKMYLGGSFKTNGYHRQSSTSDTDYWVGSATYGTVDLNNCMGKGNVFWDTWSNPANQPSGTSHWTGFNCLHYTNRGSDGSSSGGAYGWQMTMGAGTPSLLYVRGAWSSGNLGSFSWTKLWNEANDGSGSGLDADLLDGQHGSYYLDYNNFSNTPTQGVTALYIDVYGSGNQESRDTARNWATSAVSVPNNCIFGVRWRYYRSYYANNGTVTIDEDVRTLWFKNSSGSIYWMAGTRMVGA